ncbi:MAG: hypothetical protein EBR58_07965, partial [Betaproteobacteria bacterium]|nr:hypothetical protein [Betaproteobacteria bacterium]
GNWTYTRDAVMDSLAAGASATDTVTVLGADGISNHAITVTITGSNDAASIGGIATGAVTETNAVQTITGALTITDVDNAARFESISGVAGSNSYGAFSMDTAGAWTYVMGTAHNEFVGGQVYTDSTTVRAADGTSQVLTVSITGANDAPTIGGSLSAAMDENAATVSGRATINDLDSGESRFAANGSIVGTYGHLSIDTAGAWVYTRDAVMDSLAAGATAVDTVSVVAVDGASQAITVTIVGANDAPTLGAPASIGYVDTSVGDVFPVISGTLSGADADSTARLRYGISAGGNIVDDGGPTVSLTLTYGTLVVNKTSGAYTFTPNDAAINALVQGHVIDLSNINVSVTDGIANVVSSQLAITITGANDAPVFTNAPATVSFVDSSALDTFAASSGSVIGSDVDADASLSYSIAGGASSGGTVTKAGTYGSLALNETTGAYVFTPSAAVINALGDTLTSETFTLNVKDSYGASATQAITVSITGVNDAAIIGGTATGSITETNSIQSVGGALTITDVDSALRFDSISGVAGANGYGSFSMDTAGSWTYVMGSAQDSFVGGQVYTDSTTVHAADGTAHAITVTITGSNDVATIGGALSGTMDENAATATGVATISDLDAGQSRFMANSSIVGVYGHLAINSLGSWTYTLDANMDSLVAGSSALDTVTVTSADGTTHAISDHSDDHGQQRRGDDHGRTERHDG